MVARRKNQRHQAPYAVVIGLDSLQGLQTARILAGEGVPVLGIAADIAHPFCRTKACKGVLPGESGGEGLIDLLVRLGPTLAQKAVLYPCEDMSVLVLSRHRQDVQAWYHLILPDPDVVEQLMNKYYFYLGAQEKGFPIPTTRFVRSRAEAVRVVEELAFPLIVKPTLKSEEWQEHVRQKVLRVDSEEAFFDIYDKVAPWTDTLIVQEWIPGDDSALYSCNCYFDRSGVPVSTFVSRKLRQWPPGIGISSLREEVRHDGVVVATVNVLKEVGFRGLGYVEFKIDERSGKPFMIEVNVGRPTGGSPIAEAGGVALHYAMYCDALGWPLPAHLEQRYVGAKWVNLYGDLRSAFYSYRQGKLSLTEWLRSYRGCRRDAILSLSDPFPLLAQICGAAGRLIATARSRTSRVVSRLVTQKD